MDVVKEDMKIANKRKKRCRWVREMEIKKKSHWTYIPLAALEDAIEALTSGAPLELPVLRPQITLVQDYSLPLERYDDYEDDEGELRAESNLAEKFGKSSMNGSLSPL